MNRIKEKINIMIHLKISKKIKWIKEDIRDSLRISKQYLV